MDKFGDINFEDQLYYSKVDHVAFVNQQLKDSGEDKDWEVVLATEDTLMLDYDSPTVPDQFHTVMRVLEESFQTTALDYTQYKSRSGNTHVIVRLPDKSMTDTARIAWQAVLWFGLQARGAAFAKRSTRRY